MIKNIPIYIISYNRLTVLKKAIKSYLAFSSYDNLIILDNGSDYPPLLAYLSELQTKGVKIEYLPLAQTRAKRALLSNNIQHENEKRNAEYYVVTDPDIAFKDAPADLLQVYITCLEELNVEVVGPMLTIADIPEGYPAREFAWKRHVEQFWMHKPRRLKQSDIYYLPQKIDTTFGLYRSSTPWERLKKGARIYGDYEAQHLDWYFTKDNMPDDQLYYMKTTSDLVMTHWSSSDYWDNQLKGEVPNWMRKIWIVKNGQLQKHKLESSNNYLRQVKSSFQMPFKKLLYKLNIY